MKILQILNPPKKLYPLSTKVVFFIFLLLDSTSVLMSQQLKPEEKMIEISNRFFDFQELEHVSVWDSANKEDDLLGRFCSFQERLNRFRDEGMAFWSKFPTSNYRFGWFCQLISLSSESLFWNDNRSGYLKSGDKYQTSEYNIPLDWKKLNLWEKNYPKYKEEFIRFNNLNLDKTDRLKNYYELLLGELLQFLVLSRNIEYRTLKSKGNFDLDRFDKLLQNVAVVLNHTEWPLSLKRRGLLNLLDNDFISIYKQYGLSNSDLAIFLNKLDNSVNMEIVKWARQKKALLMLNQKPFNFRHQDRNGSIVDLKQLLGKVVLVDFWSTYCASCIKRMPYLKKLFDKYGSQGFEVISVCLNPESDSVTISSIERNINANWKTVIIGGKDRASLKESLREKIWNEYGFSGVPQLLLFDKKGKLVMLNDELRYGDFEPLLIKLLIN